jgi:hypothetical protein
MVFHQGTPALPYHQNAAEPFVAPENPQPLKAAAGFPVN